MADSIKPCCEIKLSPKHQPKNKTRKCGRKDGKVFQLPRRFSKATCDNYRTTKKKMGFTMRSSCAPWKMCGGGKRNPQAIAVLPNNKGIVRFEEVTPKGASIPKVKISYEIRGLTNGKHGFHIHEAGDLSEGCKSACAHFNPLNKNHGGAHSKERHAGDLGNIVSHEDVSKGELVCEYLSLREGKFNILGRSIIVHEDEDDLGKGTGEKRAESLKTGNAGKRLMCVVIGRVSCGSIA
jgi:Cu-Zn family superoxide dismutase